MRFEEFERLAREEWERIPAAYRAGVDGLLIERTARRHPRTPAVYTLGECVTESYPSEYGGPDTIRSAVVLYYGSFLRLSRLDPEFDWEREIWETLTHELKHHLESLAAEDSLTDLDLAMEEYFKRIDGEPYDPFFYRLGEPAGAGRYLLEDRLFIEVPPPRNGWVRFDLDGRAYRVRAPSGAADVHLIEVVDGLPEDAGFAEVYVAVVEPLTVRRRLGMLLGRPPVVRDAEAVAEPVAGE